MTEASATDSSRAGFLFDGWRPRVLATLGYLLMIVGLIAVTGTRAHLITLRQAPVTQAVTSPAAPVALDLAAADRP